MQDRHLVKKPIRACWLMTNRCNYNCQFCHRVLDKRELYFNEAIIVADKLIKAGVKKISFSGGEPLLWSGLLDLIKYVKRNGMLTMMITNGSLMSTKMLYEYSKVLDWITLPIDGSTEDMQLKMTRDPGHLEKVLRIIEVIDKEKLPLKVKINTVYSKPNQDDLLNIARTIGDIPIIKRWKIFQFYPIRGTALRFQNKFLVSRKRFIGEQKKVMRLCRDWKGRTVFFASNKDLERTYFTLAPDASVYISYNYKDYYMGDLKIDSVEEIWENKMYDKDAHGKQASWILPYTRNKESDKIYQIKRQSGVVGGGVL